MMRFSEVQTTSDLRRVLKTTSFISEDEPYDAEWAEIVMRKFLTYYEDPNEILQKQHINIWSLVIDHGLCNVIGMETVRKELTSVAVATRKNRKRARTRRRKPERKKMDIGVCLSEQVRFEEKKIRQRHVSHGSQIASFTYE